MSAPSPASSAAHSTKLILFFTIFTAMLGLSILFPIVAPLGRQLGLSETQTGWFATAYSLMQLLCSPLWGRRSEVHGRKPILITGLVGFSLSFGLFGLVAELGLRGLLGGAALFALLVLARVIGGVLSSATLPTAQAMMADLSSEQDRAASLGLIGAAFGLGVVFGPGLGALLSGISLTAPVYFSAGLGLLTAVVAARALPETRRPAAAQEAAPDRRALIRGAVPALLAVSALSTLASVGMEQTIGFYVQDTLNLTPAETARTVGGMLAVFGIVAALVQGGAIRPLSRKVAPGPLVALGLLVMAVGLVLLPEGRSFWPITLALAVIGAGSAVLGPSLSAALSLSVGAGAQGAIAGLNASALALGRLTGPLLGTWTYQHVGHAAPFLTGAAVLALLLAWTLLTRPFAGIHPQPAQGA